MPRRKWIDKSTSTTYQLVHRPQNDPRIHGGIYDNDDLDLDLDRDQRRDQDAPSDAAAAAAAAAASSSSSLSSEVVFRELAPPQARKVGKSRRDLEVELFSQFGGDDDNDDDDDGRSSSAISDWTGRRTGTKSGGGGGGGRVGRKNIIRDNEGEAAEHGVFYDDSSYDYMQHLRDLGEEGGGETTVWVEAPQKHNSINGGGGKGKAKISLEDALSELLDDNGDGDGDDDGESKSETRHPRYPSRPASSIVSRTSHASLLDDTPLPAHMAAALHPFPPPSSSSSSVSVQGAFSGHRGPPGIGAGSGSHHYYNYDYQSQQDVPDAIAGFQPDMDPRLREVLEALEDDAYVVDDDNDNDDDDDGDDNREGKRGDGFFAEIAKGGARAELSLEDFEDMTEYRYGRKNVTDVEDPAYDGGGGRDMPGGDGGEDEDGWESDRTARQGDDRKDEKKGAGVSLNVEDPSRERREPSSSSQEVAAALAEKEQEPQTQQLPPDSEPGTAPDVHADGAFMASFRDLHLRPSPSSSAFPTAAANPLRAQTRKTRAPPNPSIAPGSERPDVDTGGAAPTASVISGATSLLSSNGAGRRKKRKGALTDPSSYSMTSSSLRRTEGLSALDARFEKTLATYAEEDEDEDEDGYDDDGSRDVDAVSAISGMTGASRASGLSRASKASSQAPSLVDLMNPQSGSSGDVRAGQSLAGIMDEFLEGYSGKEKKGRARKGARGGRYQTGMQQLDEIRKELGPPRIAGINGRG